MHTCVVDDNVVIIVKIYFCTIDVRYKIHRVIRDFEIFFQMINSTMRVSFLRLQLFQPLLQLCNVRIRSLNILSPWRRLHIFKILFSWSYTCTMQKRFLCDDYAGRQTKLNSNNNEWLIILINDDEWHFSVSFFFVYDKTLPSVLCVYTYVWW